MKPTSLRTLGVLASLSLALGVLGLDWWSSRGGAQPAVPWTLLLVEVLVVVAVLAAALPVRRWTAGDLSRRVEPLQAARTAVFAKAASHAGALLAGWFAAQALLASRALEVEPQRDRAVLALLATLGALAVVVAGLVAERWCRVPPRDDDRDDHRDDHRDTDDFGSGPGSTAA